MNLAIFIRSLYTGTGGAEKQALLLLKCLADEHNMHLIVFKGDYIDPKYAELIPLLGVRYHYLKGNLVQRLFQLFSILKKNKINVIFSYLAINNFWGGIIGRLSGVKTIIGGIRNSKYSSSKLLLQKIIHNYLSDYTIFNNYKGYHELVQAGFQKNKAIVIPNGIIMEKAPHVHPLGNLITIVTMARFVPQKDHLVSMKAIRHLLDNYLIKPFEIKYLMIGYGPLENEMKACIRSYQLENEVELVIRPSNLEDYYRNADIYLCASTHEGVSNSVLEALSFGLPVVATDVGDNKNLIIDGENGYIVSVGDYAAMAGYLHELIQYPEKRRQFGKKGYYHCRTRYSVENFRQAYMEFIDLIGNK